MSDESKAIHVSFFRSTSGIEPVREWLKELKKDDRTAIGVDIKVVEFGWPVGMPTCRSITGYKDLWEVRSQLIHGRIARIIFIIRGNKMILLHGFMKKTEKTPQNELDIAVKRRREYDNYV